MTGSITGWTLLLRIGLRRERLLTPLTVVLFGLLQFSTAASIAAAFGDSTQVAQLRAGAGSSTAFIFLLGPMPTDDGQAALSFWRAGLFLIAALGVCAAMATVRHTRKEEESERTELVLAGAVGAWAPLVAATVTVLILVTASAAAVAVVIAAYGGGTAAVAVFAQCSAMGAAAIGIALLAAEVAASGHSANLTASSVVVGGYLLRGVADAVPTANWLRWCTPMGWIEAVDPFGATRWWPIAAALGLFAAGAAAAGAVRLRRDLGAGLVPPRAGRAQARLGWSLPAVVGRLTTTTVASWAGGLAVYALVVGTLAKQVESLAADNDLVRSVIVAGGGGTLTDMYLGTMMGILAVAAAGAGVAVVVAMRAHEKAGRTALLLSTPVSRRRHFLTWAGAALSAMMAALAAAAVAVVVGAGLSGAGWSDVAATVFSAAAVALPAAVLTVTIALAAYGWRAGAASLGWLVLLAFFALGPFAELLGIPDWLRELSPFTHVPSTPVPAGAWLPLTVTAVLAALVTAAGTAVFARRDLG